MSEYIFQRLKDLYGKNRRGGTTTLIKRAAEENDGIVIVDAEYRKSDFSTVNRVMSFADVITHIKESGDVSRPILLDNHTVMRLCEIAMGEFGRLQDEINKRDALILTIRNMVSK